MSSLCTSALLLCLAAAAHAQQPVLRVCSDPGNMPFSNQQGEGFENRVAELFAHGLNAKLEYVWAPQSKNFIGHTLGEGRCDVLIGVPSAMDSVLPTKPWYRSTYVFVARAGRQPAISSLTDPRLASLRIGINIVGDGYAPPAVALSHRGLSANLIGFSLSPPSKIIEAVTDGAVDVAVAWGPLAGYLARQNPDLAIAPVSPSMFMAVPFTYDISAAVSKDNPALKARLDNVIDRQCSAIQKILAAYGVPQAAEGESKCEGSPALRSAVSH